MLQEVSNASDEHSDYADDGDEASVPRSKARLPGSAAVCGLALAGAVFLPLLPDGTTFFDLVVAAFSRGLLEGLLTVVGLGSPFVFGLAVALAVWLPSLVAARVVRLPIALLHSQLIVVMWTVWSAGGAIAALPMLGFSVASAVAFSVQLAARRASSSGGPSLRWHIQWGAMMVVAIIVWVRLQMFAGFHFRWALTLALAATVLLRYVTRSRPAS